MPMPEDLTIPQEMRRDLCQLALNAQAECLAAFDTIEDGDLVVTVAHLTAAVNALLEANTALKPLAALALVRARSDLAGLLPDSIPPVR